MKCLLDVDRIEIGNEDYRIFRAIGDKEMVTTTASLSGNVWNEDARVLVQVTVPFDTDLSKNLLAAKQFGDKIRISVDI